MMFLLLCLLYVYCVFELKLRFFDVVRFVVVKGGLMGVCLVSELWCLV